MSDYPVPGYAAQIWVTGDTLWLSFPSLVGGQGHSVSLPANEIGFKHALIILRERNKGSLNIGLKGAPTKWDVEQQLKNDRRYNEILRALHTPKRSDDPLEAAVDDAVDDFFKEEAGNAERSI